MPDTSGDRASAIQSVLAASADRSEEVQRAAVAGVIPRPTDPGKLWLVLVAGLVALTGLALIGVMYAVLDSDKDTSPTEILTVFTPLLTGLIGLFAPSPVASDRS